eukprot:70842_1
MQTKYRMSLRDSNTTSSPNPVAILMKKSQPNYQSVPSSPNVILSGQGHHYTYRLVYYLSSVVLCILCIMEIIMLCLYFDDSAMPSSSQICILQMEFAYFILAKLLISVVFISWFSATKCMECDRSGMLMHTFGLIGFISIFTWCVMLNNAIVYYPGIVSHDERNCKLLISFMMFEIGLVYAVALVVSCACCFRWFGIHGVCYSNTYNMYG